MIIFFCLVAQSRNFSIYFQYECLGWSSLFCSQCKESITELNNVKFFVSIFFLVFAEKKKNHQNSVNGFFPGNGIFIGIFL